MSLPRPADHDSQGDAEKWRILLITGVGLVLSMTTWFSATAVTPQLITDGQLSLGQAAWLTNAVQLGFVLGALGSSLMLLADIWPITRLMAGAALLAGGANLLLLVEPEPMAAIALRVVTGVALAGVYPPALKFIATWFQRGRGLAMGAMVGALTLGSALPHLLRSASSALDWQAVILASSLGCLAAALIFGLALREGPFAFVRTRVDIRQMGHVLRNRPVMLANLGYFGHMWELYAMWGWFLTFALAAKAGGLALGSASFLTFAVLAMGAPGCVMAGWLADRIGRCNTTALMMILSGTAALLIGLVFEGPFWAFALVALIWGLTVVADSAQFSAAVSELADQTLVGSALAFQMGVGFAITIFVIWLLPLLADTLGSWRWGFAILVPGPVIGTIAMLKLRRLPQAIKMANGCR